MKSKNRTLRQQVEEMSQSAKPPRRAQKEAALLGIQPEDPFIQAHIRELNGTVGKHQTVLRNLHFGSVEERSCIRISSLDLSPKYSISVKVPKLYML